MASRPLIKPFPAIVNGDMSTTLVSIATIIDQLSIVSYAYSWSGTAPSGLISVEASNDYQQNVDGSVRVAGTWTTLPLSVSPTVSGNTGSGVIDIGIIGVYALRTRYVPSSGVGLLQATLNAKVS